jgi:DnaK suppressor protein
MPNNDLRKIQEQLLNERKEVLAAITNRDDIQIERASDTLDEIQNAALRDLAVRHLDLEAHRLRQIESALRRIREGTYGVCVNCEEEINPKRLAALPWASLCVRCQQQVEEARREAGDDEDLVRAA